MRWCTVATLLFFVVHLLLSLLCVFTEYGDFGVAPSGAYAMVVWSSQKPVNIAIVTILTVKSVFGLSILYTCYALIFRHYGHFLHRMKDLCQFNSKCIVQLGSGTTFPILEQSYMRQRTLIRRSLLILLLVALTWNPTGALLFYQGFTHETVHPALDSVAQVLMAAGAFFNFVIFLTTNNTYKSK
jgi:hypothetical protein